MDRRQQTAIEKDLNKKIVFLTGPRQVGKTWLAKEIAKKFEKSVYLSYDRLEDRKIIKNEAWLQDTQLLVLDELHKMPQWKNYLKGVFDTRAEHLKIIVTGSARLDTFRKGGDSLAGRFFMHRILPLSFGELQTVSRHSLNETTSLDLLMKRGGFPEPFLAETDLDAERWRMQYFEGIIRRDILDFKNIHDLRAMHLLIEMLKSRVGSSVSYIHLARDLEISPHTVKKYIGILESLYIVFLITPHSKNIARSLLKEPKVYFYDIGLVEEPGARLENLVALSLLKETYACQDYQAQHKSLHYLRTKDGKEVDFCLCKNQIPEKIIEVKMSDSSISPSLRYFSDNYSYSAFQVVKHLKREYQNDGIQVLDLQKFLKKLF